MSDYRGYLANCTLHGIEFTDVVKNGNPWKARNLIRLNAGGFELQLHQDPNLPTNLSDLVGQQIWTTEFFVRNVEEADVPNLRKVIENVCELLSFSTESRVLPYYSEYPAGSELWEMRAMVGTVQMWRRPFEQAENAKHLIDTCFDTYVQLRDRRMLHVAINYIHHSVKMGLAAEARLALACVAFENLRYNWAIDTGYKFIDNAFHEKVATPANPGPFVGIARHLGEMFAELHMAADAERIVHTRNKVIHTGLYEDVQNYDTYDYLETVLREYFLRLVGYHGPFLPCKGGGAVPIVI